MNWLLKHKNLLHDMRALQTRLIFKDSNRDQPETQALASAYTSIYDPLTGQPLGRPKTWRLLVSRHLALLKNFDCSRLLPGRQKTSRMFITPNALPKTHLNLHRRPMASKNNNQGQILCSVGSPQQKNSCGVPHFNSIGHAWSDCFSNPINAQKKADFYKTPSGNKGNGNKSG